MRMNKHIHIILIFTTLIASCRDEKKILKGDELFLSNFNITQLGLIKNNIHNTSVVVNKNIFHDSIIGFDLKAYVGVNSENYLSKYDGFIFYQGGEIYAISSCTTKPYKILDFNMKKGDSLIINCNGKFKVILEDIFLNSGYKMPVFKYRIRKIFSAGPNFIGPTDMVIFINPFDGIIGLYYSIVPLEKYCKKEIIYHIQGDIMLLKNNCN